MFKKLLIAWSFAALVLFGGIASNWLLIEDAGWTPAELPSLIYGCDPGAGVTTTGWTDTWSGTSNDLVINTTDGAGNPTTTTWNGLTVLEFAASNATYWMATSGNTGLTGSAAYTMVFALDPDTTSIMGVGGQGNRSATGQATGLLMIDGFIKWFADGNSWLDSTFASSTDPQLLVLRYSGSGATLLAGGTIRANAADVTDSTGNNTSTVPNLTNTVSVINYWAPGTGSHYGVDGKIGAAYLGAAAWSDEDIGLLESHINDLLSIY